MPLHSYNLCRNIPAQNVTVAAQNVTAYAGIHNIRTERKGNELEVSRVHQHPGYVATKTHIYNDISILELTPQSQQKISMNSRINYAMLPSTRYRDNYHKLTVSGWGRLDSGKLSDVLQFVQIPHVPLQGLEIPWNTCAESVEKEEPWFKTVQECQNWPRAITGKKILAGDLEEGGVGSCHGDSGGNQL